MLYNVKPTQSLNTLNIEELIRMNGNKPGHLAIRPATDCKLEIVKLATIKEFYAKDISIKLSKDNTQRGFGFTIASSASFLGFILFKYENHEIHTKTVRLHLEYLLVNDKSRGLGSQMVSHVIQVAEKEYPEHCIQIYAEAKPSDIAIHFWLSKLCFQIQSLNFIEGVYYPMTKILHRNYMVHDETSLNCKSINNNGCVESSNSSENKDHL